MARKVQLWYHMSKHDRAIFASFILSQQGRTYDKLWFDYRLGDGLNPGPSYTAEWRNMVAACSSFRADVIGFRSGHPTVIECKPYAGLAAYGQIQGYSMLYFDRWRIEPSKLLVTDRPRPDLPYLCDRAGIQIVYVQPAAASYVDMAEDYTRPIIEDLPR